MLFVLIQVSSPFPVPAGSYGIWSNLYATFRAGSYDNVRTYTTSEDSTRKSAIQLFHNVNEIRLWKASQGYMYVHTRRFVDPVSWLAGIWAGETRRAISPGPQTSYQKVLNRVFHANLTPILTARKMNLGDNR
jgi:hypothetical protein